MARAEQVCADHAKCYGAGDYRVLGADLKNVAWPLVPVTPKLPQTCARITTCMHQNRDRRLSLEERKGTWMCVNKVCELVPAFKCLDFACVELVFVVCLVFACLLSQTM